MIITIAILIALLGVFLDFKAYCRISKCTVNNLTKFAYIVVSALSYLFILVTPLIMYIFIDEHNSAFIIKFSMVLLTAFITLFVPRQLFNILLLLSKGRLWTLVSVVLSSLVFIIFLYSIFVARTDYKVNNVQLYYDNLPDNFDGYRLAFISDIHIGTMVDAKSELDEIFRIIDRCNVDAVLFGGDMVNVHHSEIDDDLLRVFSSLKPRDGVFMVFGNHDTGAFMKNSTKSKRYNNMACLEQKMQRAGWVVLRDSTVYIHKCGDSIAITGIDYNEELLKYKNSQGLVKKNDLNHIYNNVYDSLFNITISHLPQLWRSICNDGNSELVLSGHTHAMQMKFFSFSPASFMFDEWSGLYEDKNGKLYINDGIGCVGYFIRIGARPEITVIELQHKE